MDAFLIAIWIVRLAFLALLYVFLLFVVRALLRDLRAASREPAELGRLVVVGSPSGDPPVGMSYPLDAVTGIGRDVNNAVVVDDPFASSDHAVLTFRGRAWYLEDAGSTNGTYLNGSRIDGLAPLGFGDEVQVGQVRFRLERGRV
ncbi:MAG TPA: FHA domain-containing protein [Candidatus Limnocylindrales bacterium]|nr:FHA domain-containing protein [Candidatus Limnocylindrales bacterium]